MRQGHVTEQLPDQTQSIHMERWDIWSMSDMLTTGNIQVTASNDLQRQIPSDAQLPTQNKWTSY